MNFFSRFWGHLCVVNKHRRGVRKLCFKMGLYKQGLMHDLSKYSPAEFFVGVKYFQGFRSPNLLEREEFGYSSAWLHHKGRNKHHYEYRNDKINGIYSPIKMPIKYLKESFCDRIAATKIYKGIHFKASIPYEYFHANCDFTRMHEDTAKVLSSWLEMYRDKGEKETFDYIKKNYNNSLGQNY